MKKHTTYLLPIVMILNWLGCTYDDNSTTICYPPPDWFLIDIQDSTGYSLLDTLYTDEIYDLAGSDLPLFVERRWDLLQIGFEFFEPGIDRYLKLTETDFDTLNITYDEEPTDCGTIYTLQSLRYNSFQVEDEDLEWEPIVVVK